MSSELPALAYEAGCLGGNHTMRELNCVVCGKSERVIAMESGPQPQPQPQQAPGAFYLPFNYLSDALRLCVVRELWKLHNESGRIHMDQTLTEYERLIRERAK